MTTSNVKSTETKTPKAPKPEKPNANKVFMAFECNWKMSIKANDEDAETTVGSISYDVTMTVENVQYFVKEIVSKVGEVAKKVSEAMGDGSSKPSGDGSSPEGEVVEAVFERVNPQGAANEPEATGSR